MELREGVKKKRPCIRAPHSFHYGHSTVLDRAPKKKRSFVEIGCGKYITVVTPPFKIVLALIYLRHSTGDPEHATGGIEGAHGRGGGVGVDHQDGRQGGQGLGHGEEFRVKTVVSDDNIVFGGCWGND